MSKRKISMIPRPSEFASYISGNINGRPATPMEIAAMKKAMMPVLGHVNTQLGHVGVQLGQMRKQQAAAFQAGTFSAQINIPTQTKQPQDKVLRLVTKRGTEKKLITNCIIMIFYIMGNAFVAGWAVSEGPWWANLASLSLALLGMGFMVLKVRKFFKEAEAKADLLNWPDQ